MLHKLYASWLTLTIHGSPTETVRNTILVLPLVHSQNSFYLTVIFFLSAEVSCATWMILNAFLLAAVFFQTDRLFQLHCAMPSVLNKPGVTTVFQRHEIKLWKFDFCFSFINFAFRSYYIDFLHKSVKFFVLHQHCFTHISWLVSYFTHFLCTKKDRLPHTGPFLLSFILIQLS